MSITCLCTGYLLDVLLGFKVNRVVASTLVHLLFVSYDELSDVLI